ncbi:VapE domain-containing protein [Celeribacter sp.]|uniref:VapE domain-containing protein n=1 Tax=Celeribacter sp. TaxID=1890673 RepID=UPI003A932FD0
MSQLHSSKTWAAEREEHRSCLADWQNREAAAWHEQCLDLAQTDEQYTLLLDHKVGTPLGQLEAALSGFWSDSDNAALQAHNAMMRNKQQDPMPEGEWPHMTGSGKPLSTLANLKRLLGHYGIHPRYNLINKRDEAIVPGLTATRDNSDAATLAHVKSLAHMNRLPVGELGEYLLTVADENAHNPVLTWIESKPWDGVDRLEDLLDSVVIPADFDYTLRDTLITRWLVSAVAALAKPTGFHARGVLVFTGAQGIGKTSWFRNLLPASLSEYFREGAAIDPADKDSITGAVSNWLVEIGELDATFRKADIARLKAFVTNGEDRIRKPYARTESMLPRRTVFCASVNDAQFLVDTTGNSRFWTVEVASLVYESITDDLQQLWAQVYAMFKDGEQWWLTPEEEAKLAASNSAFEQVDPLEELFLSAYDMDAAARERVTASEVLKHLGYDKPNRRQQTDMSQVLKKHCGDYIRTGKGRFYNAPLRKI